MESFGVTRMQFFNFYCCIFELNMPFAAFTWVLYLTFVVVHW